MKTFTIGDIHGGHKALLQCLERSGIDKKNNRLLCLGDVVDGWSGVPKCFDILLEFKNLIYVIGNHDVWFLDWLYTGYISSIWTSQGGIATLDAYKDIDVLTKIKHQELLVNSLPYYVDEKNNLFVHGGFNWYKPIEEQSTRDLTWNRRLWESLCDQDIKHIEGYTKIFIGHTPTAWLNENTLRWGQELNSLKPIKIGNVWNLDQGGGYEGKLTIMNVETEEYWQSDKVLTLYPNEKGR